MTQGRKTQGRRAYREPEAVRALADAAVRCRTYGHGWEEFTPLRRVRSSFGERLSLLCVRCGTQRHDVVSWVDGSVLDRQYAYPEGYHLAEKVTRSEFRTALLHRRRAEARRAG